MTVRHHKRPKKSFARSGRLPARRKGGANRSRGPGRPRSATPARPTLARPTLARRKFALTLIGGTFFFLWATLVVLGQEEFWPLLAAPVLLSAWYFFEAGALATVVLTGLLLVQAPFGKSAAIVIAVTTFGLTGLGLGWGQRRQKLMHRHTLRTSVTDSLTGLYNYGYFMECLDRELHRAQRYGGSVTLVMFDIDHFKLFNDHFGHQAGNDALVAVAATLRREKRASDVAARFGGEEFVMLIPGDERAGIETAGRLRRAIAQVQVPVGGGATTGLTVSAGVASYPQGASSKEELLSRADQLLYNSKKSGRNKVTAAPAKRRLAVS